MTETYKFFNPPIDERFRIQYLHGYMDGCKAGGVDMLELMAQLQPPTPAIDPEIARRKQLAETEILEADARIKKALADTREFYAQRRKPAPVP